MTNFFHDVHCVEELKRQYRHLALENHPDAGGDEMTMKLINLEYEELFKVYGNIHTNAKGEVYENKKEVFCDGYDDGYRAVIDALAGLVAKGLINIELCGSWLWISGETLQCKDYIKATGAKWSGNKKMWYWHPEEGKKWYKGKGWSIDKIRSVFGSESVEIPGAPEVAIPF